MEVDEGVLELYERAKDHADDLFVGEERTSNIVLWEDGDFRIEVYSGFDTRKNEMHHGEQIRYHDSEGKFVYSNFTREFGWHTDRCLKEYVIEEVES